MTRRGVTDSGVLSPQRAGPRAISRPRPPTGPRRCWNSATPPTRVAQSLRLQRTHVIGLVTDAIATSFAGRVLAGAIDRAAGRRRAHRLRRPGAPRAGAEAVEALATPGRRPRLRDDEPAPALHLPRTTLPMVLANCLSDEDSYTCVVPTMSPPGAPPCGHLLGLGHTRFVMLGGPGTSPGCSASRASAPGSRRRGRLGQERGLGRRDRQAVDDRHRLQRHDPALHRRARPGPAGGSPPAAIFAVGDHVATEALLALGSLGLRVPHDVSVLGFDDQEQLAAHVVPALSTFALPHRTMGEVAVDRLLAQLSRRAGPRRPRPRAAVPFIERDSTAAAPTDGGGGPARRARGVARPVTCALA